MEGVTWELYYSFNNYYVGKSGIKYYFFCWLGQVSSSFDGQVGNGSLACELVA